MLACRCLPGSNLASLTMFHAGFRIMLCSWVEQARTTSFCEAEYDIKSETLQTELALGTYVDWLWPRRSRADSAELHIVCVDPPVESSIFSNTVTRC